ncbi:lantibiotic dehydratase family protein [Flavobacterium sp.]|uniref:lantibiotic dehydratase family protein n=1 Tax=Flavobacterium sp. TaxID=239 RepID=UPI0039E24020
MPTLHPFSNFILRNPAFPIRLYLDLLKNYSDEKLLGLYQNRYFKEAIGIASPDLMTALDHWTQHSKEKKQTVALSFLKYTARICSRCTPFGLFAGCSVGALSDQSRIVLSAEEHFTRHTQFDMHYWIALLQHFAKRKDVVPYLLFYPNSSLYAQGDFYRYIEYKYLETNREHHIAAVPQTEMLADLLRRAQTGMTVSQMVALLAEDTSEQEEALEYIHQLIDFQLLVSELDAPVTGNDEWQRVFGILSKIPALGRELDLLQQTKVQLDWLDQGIVPESSQYTALKKLVAEIDCPYDEKYLFQTDLNTATVHHALDQKIATQVKQALHFLNGIQQKQPLPNQQQFIKAFSQRYETREMPLATVLDTETGIGYLQQSGMNDMHPLLDPLSFKTNGKPSQSQNWSPNDLILEQKLQQAIAKDQPEILLTEKDFPDFDSHWEHSPATLSVMLELVSTADGRQIALESVAGISAAKLLGRFCHGNPGIHRLTLEIIEKETAQFPDKILAEIAHIPQSRTGNILRRPVLREFEIPYLSPSGVARDFQIPVSDLMVSVKDNAIVLRSKKHNKEVIPCLSNAHNYSHQALPIYQFLCDLQAQRLKPVYGFDWGILQQHYVFFPRVVYKEVILAKAKWRVADQEIAAFHPLAGSDLATAFETWKQHRKIPRWVNWVNGDNTLLLDLDTVMGIQLFLRSVKNYTQVTLEEFLFDADTVVKNTNGDSYTNQIILSFFKQ